MAKNLKLKAARAALDMTQADLAAVVGVSRQTINAIEKGEYNPTINLCRSICRVLGKTLDELFWEEWAMNIKEFFKHDNLDEMQKQTLLKIESRGFWVLCFATLQLTMKAYKKRHAELENPEEDNDENE